MARKKPPTSRGYNLYLTTEAGALLGRPGALGK